MRNFNEKSGVMPTNLAVTHKVAARTTLEIGKQSLRNVKRKA